MKAEDCGWFVAYDASMALGIPPQLASIEKEVQGIFKFLATGFQRIDKIKDAGRQSKHLEELSARMRGAKRWTLSFNQKQHSICLSP